MPGPFPFNQLWFCLAVGLFVGACLGSFATMLSYRMPRRLSIIKPDSFCPTCHASLRARDLVPVLSWTASGGRCQHCKTKISARYPLIEIVTAALSMAAFAWFGFDWPLVGALIAIVLVVSFATMKLEE